jgi:hypothetical protein
MDIRPYLARSFAALALGAAASAHPALEPCGKNHYILDAPCALGWMAVNTGLTHLDVRVVAIDPVDTATVYAGGRRGLFKSGDGGASWSITGLSAMETKPVAAVPFSLLTSAINHLAIDPRNPRTLYAATGMEESCDAWQRRVFKSVDAGATWTDTVSPFINGCDSITALVLAPSDPATLYLANFDGIGDGWSPIVRSTNGTATWDYLGHPWLRSLAVDPFDSRTVYGGTYDFPPPNFTNLPNGVIKSVDGGITWSATGLTGRSVMALAVDPASPQTVYAAAGRLTQLEQPYHRVYIHRFAGMMKSVDGGAAWIPLDAGLAHLVDRPADGAAIVVDGDDPNTLYFALPGSGVMRSVDAGASWAEFNDGLDDLQVVSLALAPGTPNTLYAATPSGVFKVIDALP